VTHCIFCEIVRGEAPATIVFRDDTVTAFRDIRPVAPTHILIVPNQHFDSVNEIDGSDEELIGHLMNVGKKLAKQEGVDEDGYRLVINTGVGGGQTVFHLHVHLIGGRRMRFLVP